MWSVVTSKSDNFGGAPIGNEVCFGSDLFRERERGEVGRCDVAIANLDHDGVVRSSTLHHGKHSWGKRYRDAKTFT